MRKVSSLIVIMVLLLSLTSCWDSVDLEDLLIVYGLGVDVSKDNPQNYFFTIGFPTIIEEAPLKKMEFSAEAPSLGKGKVNLQKKVYRAISYENIKVVIFGEEAARQGILRHVDSMQREPLFRGTTRFAVVQGRAVDLLTMAPPVSLLVSTFIYDSIQQNYDTTTVPISTLRKFSNQYHTLGIEPSMPYICYGANKEELNVGCVALFKGEKMIHLLTGKESRAFMLLINEINRGVLTYDYISEESGKKEYISINIKGGEGKIKTELKDGKLHIYHDITIKATLAEYTEEKIIFTEKRIKEIERILNKGIAKDLEKTLEILQKELKNDNVGYGKYVKANHPEYFDKENWNEQFSQAIIHIKPSVKIRTFGVKP